MDTLAATLTGTDALIIATGFVPGNPFAMNAEAHAVDNLGTLAIFVGEMRMETGEKSRFVGRSWVEMWMENCKMVGSWWTIHYRKMVETEWDNCGESWENGGTSVDICSSNSMGRSKVKPHIYFLDGQVYEISGEKNMRI